MDKKKRKPEKHQSKRSKIPSPKTFVPPDPRILEKIMGDLARDLVPGVVNAPVAAATELLYRSYEEPDKNRAAQLAKEALQICPDCAEAYVVLAELTSNRKEALRLYELGLAAGERALGPQVFQRDVGHFWANLETRPYMRAKKGLAHILWVVGRREEALQHLRDMLRLNPNDNQGVRYSLAIYLLIMDRDDDLNQLLERYSDEISAAWAYTKALVFFRQNGDTIEARRLLKKARKTNKHVPAYLLGENDLPFEEPKLYSPGDEREAVLYVRNFLASWKSTPGAIAWLKGNIKKKKNEDPKPIGPVALAKTRLAKNMRQENDIWQADFRQIPEWMLIANEPARPWIILVVSATNDLVHAPHMNIEVPSELHLWDILVRAMQHPAAGEPHRPTEVHVRANERWQLLIPHLEEIGIKLVVSDELPFFDDAFNGLVEHLGDKPRPGLLDMPGVTPEMVSSAYSAAASYFRRAPWKQIGYEAAIKIECDKFQSGPWYAVVMGQSGLSFGLALYDDFESLHRLWTGNFDDEEGARAMVATSVTFGVEGESSGANVDACKKYGWEIAQSDSYPEIIRKELGMTVRPALAWELELLEACLRAVPDFVDRRKQDDTTVEHMTVPVASGHARLVLSWMDDQA
jgi:tetratricopeptide (TPR) repeat protein